MLPRAKRDEPINGSAVEAVKPSASGSSWPQLAKLQCSIQLTFTGLHCVARRDLLRACITILCRLLLQATSSSSASWGLISLPASAARLKRAGFLPPLASHTFCSGTCRVSLSNGNLLTDTDAIRSIASTCRTHCGRCGLKPPFHAHAFITPICFGVLLHFMSLLKPKKRSRRRRGRSRNTERQRV